MLNTNRNSVQLIGHLGKDVEMTSFENGNKKATAILAINDYFTNKQGEKVKNTAWHKVIAWGKTAENFSSCLKKGCEVAIHGKLLNRTYVDQQGNTKYITEIVVNEFFKVAKMNSQIAEVVPF